MNETDGTPRGLGCVGTEDDMLNLILRMIDEFQKTRGRRPQLVCLNPRHLQQFMEECPDLFDPKTAIALGFRIMILPESQLPNPKVVWLPRRRPKAGPRTAQQRTELISWTEKRRKLAERS